MNYQPDRFANEKLFCRKYVFLQVIIFDFFVSLVIFETIAILQKLYAKIDQWALKTRRFKL